MEGSLGWAPEGPRVLGTVVPRHGLTGLEAWDAQAASRVKTLRVAAGLALADLDAGQLYDQRGAPTEAHRQHESYLGETVFR